MDAGLPTVDALEEEGEEWVARLQRTNLDNMFLVPPKLHNQKHLAESLLQHKTYLLQVFVPLLTTVLPYASKKWNEVDRKLRRELDANAAAAACAAAAAAAEEAETCGGALAEKEREAEARETERLVLEARIEVRVPRGRTREERVPRPNTFP